MCETVNSLGKYADLLFMLARKKISGFECFFCHKDMESPEGTRSVPTVTAEGRALQLIRYCCAACEERLAAENEERLPKAS